LAEYVCMVLCTVYTMDIRPSVYGEWPIPAIGTLPHHRDDGGRRMDPRPTSSASRAHLGGVAEAV